MNSGTEVETAEPCHSSVIIEIGPYSSWRNNGHARTNDVRRSGWCT